MKKLSIVIMSFFVLCGSASAVHEKYEEGYVFVPSVVNTDKDEVAISYLDDKVVFSQFDGGKYKIFQTTVNDTIDLQDTTEMKDLKKLGVYGTIAYDRDLNRIYYSCYERKTKDYMLYQVEQKKGVWKKSKRLKIKGIDKFREYASTLVNAGWLYRGPGISGFLNPNLTQDGSRLYFTSTFGSGKGGRDIWYIDKLDEKHWSMPQNAGDSINSETDQDYAFVSGDTLLYYASKDTAGVFSLYVSERSEDGAWLPGEVLDSVYNSSSNDYNLIGNDKGLFFISSRNTGQGEDIYRPTLIPEPEFVPFPWKLFYFDFDRDVFKDEFRADMDSLYRTMVKYMDEYDFVVNGHTDERGSDSYNMKLSLKRAQRIRSILIEMGIPAEKMTVHPYGESRPAFPNAQTEEEHALNRRVEVDIVDKNVEEE